MARSSEGASLQLRGKDGGGGGGVRVGRRGDGKMVEDKGKEKTN